MMRTDRGLNNYLYTVLIHRELNKIQVGLISMPGNKQGELNNYGNVN